MTCRLIVGCGYVGERIAGLWQRQGDTVFAITRSESRAIELFEKGFRPIVWDWLAGDQPLPNDTLRAIRENVPLDLATILIAVSHAAQQNLAPQETHVRGLEHLVKFIRETGFNTELTRWIYLSTTGVFGPSPPGGWVDERSSVSPERPSAIAALNGEQWIAGNLNANQRVVLRPVGIYGPGRVPRWQVIRDRVPLQVDPESYLNLIHVDDLAAVIEAVSGAPLQHQLYCVSDGVPVRRRKYYETISELGNWPAPLFDTLNTTTSVSPNSRREANRRVSNQRLQSELAVSLQYPSYREGLKSLITNVGNEPAT